MAVIPQGGAVTASDFGLAVASRRIVRFKHISKFGRNSDIDSAEDVWEGGGVYTGQPLGATETLEILSSDAADVALGTGARTVQVYGLHSDGAEKEVTEIFSMNGVTPVVSADKWYRAYRVKCLTFGSGGTNAGILTVRHTTTTANIFAAVPAGSGQSEVAAWTVPANSRGWLMGLYIVAAKTAGAAISVNISVRCREKGMGGYNAIRSYTATTSVPINPPMRFPIALPAGSDIKITADAVSTTNVEVSAEMDILLEDY